MLPEEMPASSIPKTTASLAIHSNGCSQNRSERGPMVPLTISC